MKKAKKETALAIVKALAENIYELPCHSCRPSLFCGSTDLQRIRNRARRFLKLTNPHAKSR